MSYCVNCGVKLGEGVRSCPLCGTPVVNPNELIQEQGKPYFPTRQQVIAPVSRKTEAIVLSSMFLSVALCCGLLNLALRPDTLWSLYAVGAAAMLWIWFVAPLLWRKIPYLLRVGINMAAMALYVWIIAIASGGTFWYFRLALPILLSSGVIGILVCWMFRKHSMLSSLITALLGIGLFSCTVDLFVDLYFYHIWSPGWSLIVFAVCAGFSIPLLVIRLVPSLREEARRRFHV